MSVASPTGPLNNTTMNKTNIIGAIAVIAFILGVVALSTKGQTQLAGSALVPNASNIPAAGTTLGNGIVLPNPSNYDYLTTNSLLYVGGALSQGNGTSVGTFSQAVRSTAVAATTTPCVTRNPFTATSTFSATFNVTTATSSAGNLIAAISSSPNATTTAIGSGQTIAANAQATLQSDGIASTTGTGILVGPSQYVVWGMLSTSGAAYGYYTYGGTCTTVFTTVN